MKWLKNLWARITLEIRYRKKLKELRKQYVELEKDLLEKEKLMKILKEK